MNHLPILLALALATFTVALPAASATACSDEADITIDLSRSCVEIRKTPCVGTAGDVGSRMACVPTPLPSPFQPIQPIFDSLPEVLPDESTPCAPGGVSIDLDSACVTIRDDRCVVIRTAPGSPSGPGFCA